MSRSSTFCDLAGELQLEDRRVEAFVLAGQPGLLVVELDALRGGVAAVDDAGMLAGATQAAARTLALALRPVADDLVFICHFRYSLC